MWEIVAVCRRIATMSDQLSFVFDDDSGKLIPEALSQRGPWSVAEVTAHIKTRLERDPLLKQISVEGELSNVTRARSGHLYFTLKDSDAQLKGVMWRSSATRLRFDPQHGDRVVASGSISVYETRGEYQLYADTMRPAGVGDLHAEFERLKRKLDTEGVFAPEHKQALPVFPRKIGIVTSPTAAAFQDVLNVLRRRFPIAEVILSPTMVQGDAAPPLIMAALENLYQRPDIDVILLVRGGGSLEDLWAFNNEELVRTVVRSPFPLITGVGHEIDFTLVDFAADHRAPTPSAAAEVAVPEAAALRLNVDAVYERLVDGLHDRLQDTRQALNAQHRTLTLLSPRQAIQIAQRQLNTLQDRLHNAMHSHLKSTVQNLHARTAALQAASPEQILARGYAIVTKANGARLNSATDAQPGEILNIRLHDGTLQARFEDQNGD
jgi:exodeoxyribonuclease VII large subunit